MPRKYPLPALDFSLPVGSLSTFDTLEEPFSSMTVQYEDRRHPVERAMRDAFSEWTITTNDAWRRIAGAITIGVGIFLTPISNGVSAQSEKPNAEPAPSGSGQEIVTPPSVPCLSRKEVHGGYPRYRVINGRHCWYASTRDRSGKPIESAAASPNIKNGSVGRATATEQGESGGAPRPNASSGPEGWSTYVNPELGTAVEYPANIFSAKVEEAPKQGPGVTFLTSDDRGKLAVYVAGEEGDTPRSYLENHLRIDPSLLAYKRVTDKFFAISGTRDDLVFYSRCNVDPKQDGKMHCVYLEYPARDKRAWDGIVTRISRSLHVTDVKAAQQLDDANQ